MRAFVLTDRANAECRISTHRSPSPGGVIIDVHRAGVCGTDIEFYIGQMPYLHEGHAQYPMPTRHEWMGTVSAVGDGVEPSWLNRRVTGDTMLAVAPAGGA